jgi:phosphate transport system substrate-binding protein
MKGLSLSLKAEPTRRMSRSVRAVAGKAIALFVILGAIAGCSKSNDTGAGSSTSGTSAAGSAGGSAPAAGGALQGAGATFPAPIYTKWFAGYQQANNVQVNYQAVGSGAGYKALKDKTVDFAASDAPLSDKEEQALGEPVVHIPSVGGAVALAYNLPGAPPTLKLSGDIIADIFLGKVAKWNDPRITAINPGVNLPASNIQPVHRTDGSGTTYIFTNYLKKVSPAWAAGPGAGKSVNWPAGLAGKGNDGVAAQIQRTTGGIGYVELAYALKNKLPFAQVKNHDGQFVTASVDSTTAAIGQYTAELQKDIKTPTVDAPGAASYPICSLTYILMYKNGGRNTAGAVKLWQWAMQPDQQKEAATLYYAPLPADVVKINKASLQTIK